MQAELGPDWQKRFGAFDLAPAAAASLGQVHRAVAKDGSPLACKLQYPDMQSAVEADLQQLEFVFAIHRRMDPVIDTREIAKEIGARVREELDYEREEQARRALPPGAGGRARGSGAGAVAEAVDTEAPDARLARGREDPELRRRAADDPQPALDRHVQGLVAPLQPQRRHPWRPASRQLHGVLGGRGGARHQSPRLRLHPHLPAEVRRRGRRSLPRAPARRSRPGRPCL